MPLATPVLDNLRFQDIVDEAKRRIPRYCPEWTDHNVSDPGVALIELFAWMTDMLIYRVNQIPDKNYIKFLELIGVRLDPPQSAQVPVTFYLSAAQPREIVIPRGTEVATIRTETNPAIIFTTQADLPIRPVAVLGAFTRPTAADTSWIKHDLRTLEAPDRFMSLFSDLPVPGGAFYLALTNDHSSHVLALTMECDSAGGGGIDPNNPPIEWQVWQGSSSRWVSCSVECDGTKGFNLDGEIILHLPEMATGVFQDVSAYWLRCRLTEKQANPPRYDVSPRLRGHLKVESRGGTTIAHHGTTVQNEVLGESDGTPGLTFKLHNSPILPRDEVADTLVVAPQGKPPEHWREVEDFAESGPDDHHFTLDAGDGSLTLGPSLLQPNGSVYRFGAIPPKGSALTFTRYQHGGGVEGNVPQGAISIMKSSIPYISRVSNRAAAVGGRNAQSLEDAKIRAPRNLRTRERAVTVTDFEYLACQVPGVARARCLGPGRQADVDSADPKPGHISVTILPLREVPSTAPIPSEQLTLSAQLTAKVSNYLTERCVVGCTVDIRPPQYVWVAVQAKLRVAEATDPVLVRQILERAKAELYGYLNPFRGGPDGEGWPFGRDLYVSEIYVLLQRVPSVEFVDEVLIGTSEPGRAVPPAMGSRRISVPKDGLLCSSEHHVAVS